MHIESWTRFVDMILSVLRAAILSFSEQHDYKAEADRSAAALESAEEDLNDLKKANQQVSSGGRGDRKTSHLHAMEAGRRG